MELSAGLLVLVGVAAALVALWHANLAAREAANRAAMEACAQLRLQFLDGTVAFARARPVRSARGWITLRRTYVFDYTSDSIARRRGFVVLTGPRVDSVGFESEASPTPGAGRSEARDQPPAARRMPDSRSSRAHGGGGPGR